MPRPVSIDRKQAFRAARDQFWRCGYTGTSMQQLLGVTGMGAGSFYSAFGSKAALFESVVDDYAQWSAARFDAVRSQHRGFDAIAAFLDDTLVNLSDADRRKGCLLVNSALEFDGVETVLHSRVSEPLVALQKSLEACLQEAREDGVLQAGIDPEEGAGLVMTVVQGLRVESRRGMTREQAEARIQLMIAALSSDPA